MSTRLFYIRTFMGGVCTCVLGAFLIEQYCLVMNVTVVEKGMGLSWLEYYRFHRIILGRVDMLLDFFSLHDVMIYHWKILRNIRFPNFISYSRTWFSTSFPTISWISKDSEPRDPIRMSDLIEITQQHFKLEILEKLSTKCGKEYLSWKLAKNAKNTVPKTKKIFKCIKSQQGMY